MYTSIMAKVCTSVIKNTQIYIVIILKYTLDGSEAVKKAFFQSL